MSHAACSDASVVTPSETESLGSLLDALTTALREQHYAASTIRTHLREARAFGAWLTTQPYQLRDCNELLLERYLHSCASPFVSLTKRRRQHITAAIHRLLKYLHTAGVAALPPVERLPETEVQQWLSRYGAYLDHVLVLQRGFTPVGAPVRCGVCDVRDTPHGFSAVDRPEFQAPTGRQTRAGAGLQLTAARPEVA